ncbi:MAG: hypothetical protein HY826_03090 [Actinobacteria bacterium]|nr:hypothetical protein [Actinomycetota bacterium]
MDLFDGEPFSPCPAWRVIEAARNRSLTGELALPTNPPTNIYLANGEVYLAERTTDGTIGVRLLVEGVITREQMSRGSVMVSGVEHLGRMFERDESIDRHAVELCVELMTDDVLTSVSKETVGGYKMTLYRRHSSGIDRWLPNHETLFGSAAAGETEPTSGFAPAVSEAQRATLSQDWLPPVAATPEPVVTTPEPVAVVPEPAISPPEPATVVPTLAPSPAPVGRAPERLQLEDWPQTTTPTAVETSTLPTLAPVKPIETGVAPAQPAAATQADPTPSAGAGPDVMSTAIADEVADAVRRALAAIDSVLIPGSDADEKPPVAGGRTGF